MQIEEIMRDINRECRNISHCALECDNNNAILSKTIQWNDCTIR